MSEVNWWTYCTMKIICDGRNDAAFFIHLEDDGKKYTIKRIPRKLNFNIVGPEDLFPYKTICFKCYRQFVEDFAKEK